MYAAGTGKARLPWADQLVVLGLDSDFPGLVADANVFGGGMVQLGSVRPEVAEADYGGATAASAWEVVGICGWFGC